MGETMRHSMLLVIVSLQLASSPDGSADSQRLSTPPVSRMAARPSLSDISARGHSFPYPTLFWSDLPVAATARKGKPGRRIPALAGGLSIAAGAVPLYFGKFGVDGIGQKYNGENSKSVAFLLWGLCGEFLMLASDFDPIAPMPRDEGVYRLGKALRIASCYFATRDAYLSAKRLNRRWGYANAPDPPSNQLRICVVSRSRGYGALLALSRRI